MIKKLFLFFFFLFSCLFGETKLPDLNDKKVGAKLQEIMQQHVKYKTLSEILVARSLKQFIKRLDPDKIYFLEPEIKQWLEPSEPLKKQALEEFSKNDFSIFKEIFQVKINAIHSLKRLKKEIAKKPLPKNVSIKEFQDLKWAKTKNELKTRLMKLKALRHEITKKLNEEEKKRFFQMIEKYQRKNEEKQLTSNEKQRKNWVLVQILKSLVSSLDNHTRYLTPHEAEQFKINIKQSLVGVGIMMSDNINGFSVNEIIEEGPASKSKLKEKDLIIAVNDIPIIGMEIDEAVALIRGEKNTPVTLTILRGKTDKFSVTIIRDKIVVESTRLTVSKEPYGNGIIAHIKLFSFYQDEKTSSANDIKLELAKLEKEHDVKGLILDLRNNTGGLLTQAVEVAGLFITQGIIASTKDSNQKITPHRDVNKSCIWKKPLIILVNPSTASAAEIDAQSLKEYGVALVVGDKQTFGKGSFQASTLNFLNDKVNPEGEYNVTQGMYYTISGKSPQLVSVKPNIIVPGIFSESEIGERFTDFPLESDNIKSSFTDQLEDLNYIQKIFFAKQLNYDTNNLQTKVNYYSKKLPILKNNSKTRITNNKNYQNFLTAIKKENLEQTEDKQKNNFGKNDLQLIEAFNIMKDLIIMNS